MNFGLVLCKFYIADAILQQQVGVFSVGFLPFYQIIGWRFQIKYQKKFSENLLQFVAICLEKVPIKIP